MMNDERFCALLLCTFLMENVGCMDFHKILKFDSLLFFFNGEWVRGKLDCFNDRCVLFIKKKKSFIVKKFLNLISITIVQ